MLKFGYEIQQQIRGQEVKRGRRARNRGTVKDYTGEGVNIIIPRNDNVNRRPRVRLLRGVKGNYRAESGENRRIRFRRVRNKNNQKITTLKREWFLIFEVYRVYNGFGERIYVFRAVVVEPRHGYVKKHSRIQIGFIRARLVKFAFEFRLEAFIQIIQI